MSQQTSHPYEYEYEYKYEYSVDKKRETMVKKMDASVLSRTKLIVESASVFLCLHWGKLFSPFSL